MGGTNFNYIAPVYDFLSGLVFNGNILKSQCMFLEYINEHSEILVIGGGSGKFLQHIKSKNIRIVYIEKSENMIEQCRKNNPQLLIEYRCGSFEDCLKPSEKFDAIITFYFLDLFKEKLLINVIENLAKLIKEGGKWLAADFMPPTTVFQKIYYWAMVIFFRIFADMEIKRLPNIISHFSAVKELKLLNLMFLNKNFIFSVIFIKT